MCSIYVPKSKLQLAYKTKLTYSNKCYKIEMPLMINDVVQV